MKRARKKATPPQREADHAEDAVAILAIRQLLQQYAARYPGRYMAMKAKIGGGKLLHVDLNTRDDIGDGQYLFASTFISGNPLAMHLDD